MWWSIELSILHEYIRTDNITTKKQSKLKTCLNSEGNDIRYAHPRCRRKYKNLSSSLILSLLLILLSYHFYYHYLSIHLSSSGPQCQIRVRTWCNILLWNLYSKNQKWTNAEYYHVDTFCIGWITWTDSFQGYTQQKKDISLSIRHGGVQIYIGYHINLSSKYIYLHSLHSFHKHLTLPLTK